MYKNAIKISTSMSLINKLRMLFLVLMAISPSLAMASDFSLFKPAEGDVSVRMLAAIFGQLVEAAGYPSASGGDPMVGAIEAFNAGVLAIGGVLAAYTILAGTIGTAHDGEMLGKKFSSAYLPIRYSVGTALILPVVGGGYCVMQAIVMWLVIQGVGMADAVWNAYKSDASSGKGMVTFQNSTELDAVAKNIFNSAVCYKSYNKVLEGPSASVINPGGELFSKSNDAKGWYFGRANLPGERVSCGAVMYPEVDLSDMPKETESNIKSKYEGRIGIIQNVFDKYDTKAIYARHKQATDNLVNYIDGLADKAVNAGVMSDAEAADLMKQVLEGTKKYQQDVKNGVTIDASEEDTTKKVQEASKSNGWVMAGAWFMQIIHINETIHGAANSSPSVIAPSGPKMDNYLAVDSNKFRVAASAALASSVDFLGGESVSDAAEDSAEDGGGPLGLGPLIKLVKKISNITPASITAEANKRVTSLLSKALTGVDMRSMQNDSRHPLIIVNDLGTRLLWASTAMAAALAAVFSFIAFITFGTAISTVLFSSLELFFGMPLKALMVLALACQYVIPALPYLMWIGCMVGWLLLVTEAVLAAPLWAVMHLHPNGDDLTGKGGSGYTLVLSLLLRPMFMIFGLMAAIIISAVVGEFVNKTFFAAFATATQSMDGWSNLLATIMGTAIYFSIMFTLVRKSFALTHQLPDQMMTWIGGPSGSAMGQFAGEFGQSGEKTATGAAAGIGIAGGSLAKAGKAGVKEKMQTANNSGAGRDADGKPNEEPKGLKDSAGTRTIAALSNALTGGKGLQRSSVDGTFRTASANKAHLKANQAINEGLAQKAEADSARAQEQSERADAREDANYDMALGAGKNHGSNARQLGNMIASSGEGLNASIPGAGHGETAPQITNAIKGGQASIAASMSASRKSEREIEGALNKFSSRIAAANRDGEFSSGSKPTEVIGKMADEIVNANMPDKERPKE